MEELARQFKEARTMLDDLDAAAPAPAQPQVPDAHSAMGMVRDAQGGGRLAVAPGSVAASHKLNAGAKRGVCWPRGVNCEESLVLAPAGHKSDSSRFLRRGMDNSDGISCEWGGRGANNRFFWPTQWRRTVHFGRRGTK